LGPAVPDESTIFESESFYRNIPNAMSDVTRILPNW
jgi:hypothetical protein